jgi:hypothetical protein
LFRFFLLVLAAFGIAVPIFLRTRARAALSSAARLRIIALSAVGLALGLGLALWLPPRIPETNGSPASLVAVALLWVVGGSLGFLTLTALLAAFFAKPDTSAKDLST